MTRRAVSTIIRLTHVHPHVHTHYKFNHWEVNMAEFLLPTFKKTDDGPILSSDVQLCPSDYDLCEHGINITGISPVTSADSRLRYSVSFEFLVVYKDGMTRWAKDTILTQLHPNGEDFRSDLLSYASSVRQRMKTVTLKNK